MSKYEEGMQLLEEKFGNGKDNVIALTTISHELSETGFPKPCVRDVDAYYHDGSFYIVTYALSRKVKQIELNPEVAISANFEDFNASEVGKNLGWVLDPKNAEIRTKLREVFKEWYDFANDESDKNFCFVQIKLNKGNLRINHGEKFYRFDFESKTAS